MFPRQINVFTTFADMNAQNPEENQKAMADLVAALQERNFPQDNINKRNEFGSPALRLTNTPLYCMHEFGISDYASQTTLYYQGKLLASIWEEPFRRICTVTLNKENLASLPSNLTLDSEEKEIIQAVAKERVEKGLYEKGDVPNVENIKSALREKWEKKTGSHTDLELKIDRACHQVYFATKAMIFAKEEAAREKAKKIDELKKKVDELFDNIPHYVSEGMLFNVRFNLRYHVDFNSVEELKAAAEGCIVLVLLYSRQAGENLAEYLNSPKHKEVKDLLFGKKAGYKTINYQDLHELICGTLSESNENYFSRLNETKIHKLYKKLVDLNQGPWQVCERRRTTIAIDEEKALAVAIAQEFPNLKKQVIDLFENVLYVGEPTPNHKVGKKYDLLREFIRRMKETTFNSPTELKNAAKNFIMLALQRNAFGVTNVTESGEDLKLILNLPMYKKARTFLFGDKFVKYRDLRQLVCGVNSEKFFSSSRSNKNTMYEFFSSQKPLSNFVLPRPVPLVRR